MKKLENCQVDFRIESMPRWLLLCVFCDSHSLTLYGPFIIFIRQKSIWHDDERGKMMSEFLEKTKENSVSFSKVFLSKF